MNRIKGKLITGFEDNALEAMRAYGWPGNVRGLENAVERAYILCPALTIGLKHLPTKVGALAHGGQEGFDEMNLLETEKRLIVRALTNASWNQSRAAEVLGITRKQLRTKMRTSGSSPRRPPPSTQREAGEMIPGLRFSNVVPQRQPRGNISQQQARGRLISRTR
jgi:DNA-binding NtrC family response regulator